jgi:hypothetical protein
MSVKRLISLKIQDIEMDESLSPNPGSKENAISYVCEECGEPFHSLNEYIGHYKFSHPRSIGTAIT